MKLYSGATSPVEAQKDIVQLIRQRAADVHSKALTTKSIKLKNEFLYAARVLDNLADEVDGITFHI